MIAEHDTRRFVYTRIPRVSHQCNSWIHIAFRYHNSHQRYTRRHVPRNDTIHCHHNAEKIHIACLNHIWFPRTELYIDRSRNPDRDRNLRLAHRVYPRVDPRFDIDWRDTTWRFHTLSCSDHIFDREVRSHTFLYHSDEKEHTRCCPHNSHHQRV